VIDFEQKRASLRHAPLADVAEDIVDNPSDSMVCSIVPSEKSRLLAYHTPPLHPIRLKQ
jgi:hypothetical protein